MKNWETFMNLTISKELAFDINMALKKDEKWSMPKGRFLMATVETEQRLASGIIIPDSASESKPKLGVIVYQQELETLADGTDETYCDYNLTDRHYVGMVATVGIYSGKDVYADGINEVKEVLDRYGVTGQLTFKVISAAEVAFIQPNYK